MSKTTKPINNPWGNESPEKIKDSANPHKLGFSQQVKGLVDVGSMFEMLIGKQSRSETKSSKSSELVKPGSGETLIFSRNSQEKSSQLQKETQEVLTELKQQITLLEKSEKSLSSEISKIKVEQIPKSTGIYYLRYFEWLISIVKQLRMKLEDSQSWLQAFSERSKKKMGYWKKYKKHGTTFGLSHERSMATQTG